MMTLSAMVALREMARDCQARQADEVMKKLKKVKRSKCLRQQKKTCPGDSLETVVSDSNSNGHADK